MTGEEANCSVNDITSPGIGTDSELSGNGNRLSASQLPWSVPFLYCSSYSYELKVRAQHCIRPETIGGTAFVSLAAAGDQ